MLLKLLLVLVPDACAGLKVLVPDAAEAKSGAGAGTLCC